MNLLKQSILFSNLAISKNFRFKFIFEKDNEFLFFKKSSYKVALYLMFTLRQYKTKDEKIFFYKSSYEKKDALGQSYTFLLANKYFNSTIVFGKKRQEKSFKYEDILNSFFYWKNPYSLMCLDLNSKEGKISYLKKNDTGELKIYSWELDISNSFLYNESSIGYMVDTEYVDTIKKGESVFDNKREWKPVSIALGVFSFRDPNGVLYKNYISEKKNYDYLKNHKDVSQSDKESLWNLEIPLSYKYYKTDRLAYDFRDNIYSLSKNNTILKTSKSPYPLDAFEEEEPLLISETSPFYLNLVETTDQAISIKTNFLVQDLWHYVHYLSPFLLRKRKIKHSDFIIIPFYFYFSAKDFRYFFGDCIYFLVEKEFHSRRTLRFSNKNVSSFALLHEIYDPSTNTSRYSYIKIKLIDLSGLTGSSFVDFSLTTGFTLTYKEDKDINKENIELTLIQKPDLFLKYCYEDTVYLFKMLLNFQYLNYQMYLDFNLYEFPTLLGFWNNSLSPTNGTNLAWFIRTYIYSLSKEMPYILDTMSITYERINEKKTYSLKGIEMGSSKYLWYLGGSALEGTFVSGGRCCNERPFELNFEYGLDIDLESCYGISTMKLYYPIGIPWILKNDDGSYVMTLREFITKKKRDLIPGLWYAVVSTKEPLSFNIDLFVSKDFPIKSAYKSDKEIDNMHVRGDQVVILKEILHSVIIHEHLDIINKIGSNKEKNELYDKIVIEMACIYPKKYRCSSIEELNAKIAIHETKKTSLTKKKQKKEDSSRVDLRPPYWYAIPMWNMVEDLIKTRWINQSLYKETKDPKYFSIQTFIKKNVNMFYGCIASQYFEINNLCLSNNITGIAKIAVWIMAKALNLCQTITDGGIYTPAKVLYFEAFKSAKKPSFNKLYEEIVFQKRKHFLPLGYLKNGSPWNKRKNLTNYHKIFQWIQKSKNIDFCLKKFCDIANKLAKQHIDNFCECYKISNCFIYDVSHKQENTFYRAATLNRGHYTIINLKGNVIQKIRGLQKQSSPYDIESPLFKILEDKALGRDTKLTYLTCTQKNLLKPKDLAWLKEKNSIDPTVGIHDTIYSCKTINIKLDCGKYTTIAHYKQKNSGIYDLNWFSFLSFCENHDTYLLLSCVSFWDNYHKNLRTLCFDDDFKKRVSKLMIKERDALILMCWTVDPLFVENISRSRYVYNFLLEDYTEKDLSVDSDDPYYLNDDVQENDICDDEKEDVLEIANVNDLF